MCIRDSPTACNYNPLAGCDDGSCVYQDGCTNPLACNYDSTANTDDGSCTLPGCTDPLAVNYSASAGCDDGSCSYACTAAPYSENFDGGLGTMTNNGWILDASGTGSSGTGPSDDMTGGGNYVYYETSGSPQSPITLTSECLDISALAAPALRFSYHMYGATMGTLDVSVNGTSVWSLSGDQGNVWNQANVDLSTYSGQIDVRIQGIRGTSFTGDIAIDLTSIYSPVFGCMETGASNYDPLADTDDGSCVYSATFEVDMACEDPSTFTTVHLESPVFNCFTGCTQMTDPDGDLKFSVTVDVPLGNFTYLYSIAVSYTHLTLPTNREV